MLETTLTNVQMAYLLGRNDGLPLGGISTQYYVELLFSEIDLSLLSDCLNEVIAEQPALRCVFKDNKAHYLEDVPQYKIELYVLQSDEERLIKRQTFSSRSYEAAQWPLFCFEASTDPRGVILHVSLDRLLADQVSMNWFWQDLSSRYNQLLSGREKIEVQTRENQSEQTPFIHSRKRTLSANGSKPSLPIPERYFDLIPHGSTMPLAKPSATIYAPRFSRLKYVLSNETQRVLTKKCADNNIAYESLCLYAYGFAISRFSESVDVPLVLADFCAADVYSDISGELADRTRLRFVPFRRRHKRTILQELRKLNSSLELMANQRFGDAIDLQRALRAKKMLFLDTPVFPYVISIFLNDTRSFTQFTGYLATEFEVSQTAHVLIDAQIHQLSGEHMLVFDYVSEAFKPSIIESCFTTFIRFIEYLARIEWSKPNDFLHENLVENQQIDSITRSLKTLFNGFEKSATGDPQRTAIVDPNGSFSYGELHQKAAKLHRFLIHADIAQSSADQKSRLIGVFIDGGFWQVAALLGIMRAGFAYVPMLTSWPAKRIQSVCQKCQFQAIVTEDRLAPYLQSVVEHLGEMYLVTEKDLEGLDNKPLPPPSEISAQDLAYVIFTSGSTGTPKGVMMSHGGALNTIEAINTMLEVSSGDRVIALSDYCFDLSVYDLFGILSVGGTVILPGENEKLDFQKLAKLLLKYQVTIWNSVPQHMALFSTSKFGQQCLSKCALRAVLLSGDVISVDLIHALETRNPDLDIFVLGGATECGIWSCFYLPSMLAKEATFVPYGRALAGQGMYVLNPFLEPCPELVPGEIYFSGGSLAIGYFQDAEKTNSAFITHQGNRLYKTGDWGLQCSEGFVRFLGRRDRQVKINGYRVELGEIDAALRRVYGIEEAITLIRNNEIHSYFTVQGVTPYLVNRMNGLPVAYQYADKHRFHDGQAALVQPLQGVVIKPPQRRSIRTFQSEDRSSHSHQMRGV
ncbi:amino acid adenylation domain-containing protein [Vibrio navarrensis]